MSSQDFHNKDKSPFRYSQSFIFNTLRQLNLPLPINQNKHKKKYTKEVFLRYIQLKTTQAKLEKNLIQEYQQKEKESKKKKKELTKFLAKKSTITPKKEYLDESIPEEDMLAWYLRKINKMPVFSITEQHALVETIRNGRSKEKLKARELLINVNLLFVVKIAHKYIYKSKILTILDLINEGNLGLLHAIEKFDLSFNIPFPAYAIWWIRLYILTALKQKEHTIRIPVNKIDALLKINKLEKDFQVHIGHTPAPEELANYYDQPLKEILFLLDLKKLTNMESISETGALLHYNKHTGFQQNSVEDEISELFLKEYINKKLNLLSKKYRNIIEDRFGLNSKEVITSEKLAKKYKTTKHNIYRIINKSLSILFQELNKNEIYKYLQ